MALAVPSVTSHAIGQVTILDVACDIIPDARAERKAVAEGMGGHQAARPTCSEAVSDVSQLLVLFAITETGWKPQQPTIYS